MIKLTRQDARRLLVLHHFQPTSLPGAFERLGSVQYDPLNPVGRNHDLVLQARVPGYTVDDWQPLAYRDRLLYDGWDKQASLVLMRDFPMRRIYYQWHGEHWREAILDRYPQAVATVLSELHDRGPLSSTEFHFQQHHPQWEGSWYGPKLTKNVLRALWHTGQVLTSGRNKGQHVYDLAERVVPPHLHHAAPIPAQQSIEWLILLRHQALGLLRPNAGTAVWSLGISTTERREQLQQLLRRGLLVAIDIEGISYHALPHRLALLDETAAAGPDMRFVAPLDQLLWDRTAVGHLFGFDYVWEVYKPEKLRRWGYYVLPVMYGDRFVARIDSRLNQGVWRIHRWYWEEGVPFTPELFHALEQAVGRFRRYLGAEALQLPKGLNRKTREVLLAGFKNPQASIAAG